ncbi:hypothetical protein ACFVYV_51050 [Streptomyces mirabilis]
MSDPVTAVFLVIGGAVSYVLAAAAGTALLALGLFFTVRRIRRSRRR